MKKKKIKLCLPKQLLNMFKLWCEWGISLIPVQKGLATKQATVKWTIVPNLCIRQNIFEALFSF